MRQGRFITAAATAVAALAIGPAAALATPGSFTDDAAGDFADGTVPGAAWVVEPGTVALKGTSVADNFDGTTLGAGWTPTPWGANPGSAAVSGGSLTVNNAHVNDGQPHGDYQPGKVLEFRATFGAVPFQHIGLGDTFSDAPWAMFSTGVGDADLPVGLYARTRNATAGAFNNTRLDDGVHAINPTVPHRYRIEWTSTDVRFYVDGVLVATHTIAIEPMRPVISDADAAAPDTAAVKVDWLGLSVFPVTAGTTFTSRVFDVGAASNVTWGAVDAGAIGGVPVIQTRTGNTPTPDASWSSFQQLVNGTIQSPAGRRYIQYSAALTGTEPDLDSLVIHYDVAPASQGNGNGGGGGQSGGSGAGGSTQGSGNSGATSDKTKPDVTLLGTKSLRANKKGAVSFTLACPASEQSCAITLKLKSGNKTVASKTFTVKGGNTKAVSVQLNKDARKLLNKRGSLKVSAVIKATDAAGNAKTTTKTITIRRAAH